MKLLKGHFESFGDISKLEIKIKKKTLHRERTVFLFGRIYNKHNQLKKELAG